MTVRTGTAQGAAYTVLTTRLGELTVVREDGTLTGLYFPRHWPRPDRAAFGPRVREGFEEVARQLGSTGNLTGYAGGLGRKRALLEIEHARAPHALPAGLW